MCISRYHVSSKAVGDAYIELASVRLLKELPGVIKFLPMFLVQDLPSYQVCRAISFWVVDIFSQGSSVVSCCVFFSFFLWLD